MKKVFAITGTWHGAIVEAFTEGEARRAFHKCYHGESIICTREVSRSYLMI